MARHLADEDTDATVRLTSLRRCILSDPGSVAPDARRSQIGDGLDVELIPRQLRKSLNARWPRNPRDVEAKVRADATPGPVVVVYELG